MSNFTDAINAIDEKIQHHAGEASKLKLDVSNYTRFLGNASTALDIQNKTVESLREARKILVDAETASRKDNPTGTEDDDPFIL